MTYTATPYLLQEMHPEDFRCQLVAYNRTMSAKQIAAAISPELSRRTLEDWLQGRRSPPPWTHEMILSRLEVSSWTEEQKIYGRASGRQAPAH